MSAGDRSATGSGPTDRAVGARALVLGLAATGLLFLVAVRLLGVATDAASPELSQLLPRLVRSNISALGVGWLAAYGLMNGSVVAAVAVALHGAGLVTPAQLLLLVAGSRLGAAAVVVLLGALDFVHHRRGTIGEATALGFLAFVLTITVYVPATALGLAATGRASSVSGQLAGTSSLPTAGLRYLDPPAGGLVDVLGPVTTAAVAVALLFVSLWLFDGLLARGDVAPVRRLVGRGIRRTWSAFAVGLVVTGLTTSVSFSLGVVVPLYNRGFVRREEAIPYVLGANIGTLLDTLLVAVVLESHGGVAVVLTLLASALLVTVAALVGHRRYRDAVGAFVDRLLADRRWFVGFAVVLVLVPVALVVVG